MSDDINLAGRDIHFQRHIREETRVQKETGVKPGVLFHELHRL